LRASQSILTFNCGSSSLGCRLYELGERLNPQPVFSAKAHRVGVTSSEASFLQCETEETSEKTVTALPDHRTAARRILEIIEKRGLTVDWIGHRFVHGGETFNESVAIDRTVMEKLRECAPLAPIHNPLSLSVIHECGKALPGQGQYVTFDTAFHSSLPDWAYTYAVPQSVQERFHYRRYGFHGLSYSYIARAAPAALGRPADGIKMVACHLGTGGSSVCAMQNGRSLDTSMGYSPLTGLLMSTRCGDIDPLLSLHLIVDYDMRPDDVLSLLTDRSGLLGVAGFSSDLRDILHDVTPEREERADLAFQMYVHRLRKYIGSYAVALGGIDALVFTDDIGVTDWRVREQACENMEWCGLKLDREVNRRTTAKSAALISDADSRVQVLVIPTQEELVIAQEVTRLILGRTSS
jgi:acetate kinase